MTTSPWLARRLEGLTGSDIAPVLGLPWPFGGEPKRTAVTVWAEKTGKVEAEDIGHVQRVRLGSRFEDALREEYQYLHGRILAIPLDWPDLLPGCAVEWHDHIENGETVRKVMLASREFPWLLYTPDDIIRAWTPLDHLSEQEERAGPGILEIKTTDKSNSGLWSGDAPPLWFQGQPLGGCLAAGLSWLSHFVLVGGNETRTFDTGLSQATAQWMIETLGDFWENHVQKDIMPEVSASSADARVLKEMFPEHAEGKTVDLPAEFDELDDRREWLKRRIESDGAEVELINNKLRRAMGDAEIGLLAKPGEDAMVRYTMKTQHTREKKVPAYDSRPIRRRVL